MSILSKMMRIAGRGQDGTAKAIATDNEGRLLTQVKSNIATSGVSLNNAQVVGNGTPIPVNGGTSAYFDILGTFEGTIRLTATVGGSSIVMPAYLVDDFKFSGKYFSGSDIIKAGRYVVAIPVGATAIFARLHSYTSGAVSANVYISAPTGLSMGELFGQTRVIELGRGSGVSVDAGATVVAIDTLSVREWPYQHIAVRANADHAYKAYFYYSIETAGSLGAIYPDIAVIDSTTAPGDGVRKYMPDWFEAKGERLLVRIKNLDSVAHTYDVVLYGVR